MIFSHFRNTVTTLYESQDFLKYVKIYFDPKPYVYIINLWDELKFIKQLQIGVDSNNHKTATPKNEYYVNQDFIGENTNYVISNKTLYWKFQAFLLQTRGGVTQNLALIWEPEKLSLDRCLFENIYPIHSKNWLLYYGAKEKINYYNKTEYETLIPLFNNPKVTHLSGIIYIFIN